MKACNRYYLIFLVFIFCFSSCQESREKQIYRLVQEWTDKEIFFPKNPVFTIQGRDTVSTSEREQFSVKKVLVYVDSVGCMSCRLQLQTSNELNGLALDNVEAIARGEGGGFGYTSHTYKCSYPDYKWAVAYTKGGVDSCYPSDC